MLSDFMLSAVMLSVIMLSAIMLNVVVARKRPSLLWKSSKEENRRVGLEKFCAKKNTLANFFLRISDN